MEITHIKPLHEARASQVAIKSGRTGEHTKVEVLGLDLGV